MKKPITVLAALILLALGLFLVLYPQFLGEEEPAPQYISTTIPVMHQYRNGVHTYVGEIQTPTPCHAVTGQAIVSKSLPAQVEIRIETRDAGGVCIQVIDVKKFRVSFAADKDPVVTTYLNSTPILFKVTEAPRTVDLTEEVI